MRKQVLLTAVLALWAMAVTAMPVAAAKPMEVSGRFAYAGPPTNVVMRSAGPNCIIDVDVLYAFYEGDLDGLAPMHFRVVSHGPCPAEPFQNRENLHATGTFTGTVAGRSGTFDFSYSGRGWPAEPGNLALSARLVILSGTEELQNLHGVLDISYVMGETFDSFSGNIHYAP